MKVVIVGAGRMGFSLTQRLDQEGHQVFVVDPNPSRIERVKSRQDVMAMVGSGSSLRTLREMGIEGADLFLAVSGSDEVNIVSCLQARQLGIGRRIARVTSNDMWLDLQETDPQLLGVSEFVNPTRVTVERLSHMVLTPGTAESAEFASGEVILRALRVQEESTLTSAPLRDMTRLFANKYRIAAVRRENDLIVPTGSFQIQPDDTIYAIMPAGGLENFLRTFDLKQPKRKRIFISGANTIGIQLAARLEKEIADTILIDPDRESCSKASTVLSSTSIIQGSPLDQPLMEDLKIGGAGYFLAVSDNDEMNLTSALMARKLGARDSVILTSNPNCVNLYEDLPIGTVVSPVLLSVGDLLRTVREGQVLSLFNLAGDRGEAVEIKVPAKAPVTGKALHELDFPAGVMVAAVIGRKGVAVASGDTVIAPGDRVIAITLHEASDKAIAMFSA